MDITIKRKIYTNKFVYGELYINGEYHSNIIETINNINNIVPKGIYLYKQFFSVRMQKIVIGLSCDKEFYDQNKVINILQDYKILKLSKRIKFTYRYNHKKYKLNIE